MCVERTSEIWYPHKSQVYSSVLMTTVTRTNIRSLIYPHWNVQTLGPTPLHLSHSLTPTHLPSYSLESTHKWTHSVFLFLILAYFKFMHVALNIVSCFFFPALSNASLYVCTSSVNLAIPLAHTWAVPVGATVTNAALKQGMLMSGSHIDPVSLV